MDNELILNHNLKIMVFHFETYYDDHAKYLQYDHEIGLPLTQFHLMFLIKGLKKQDG